MGVEADKLKALIRGVAPEAVIPQCYTPEEAAAVNAANARRDNNNNNNNGHAAAAAPAAAVCAGMQTDELRGCLVGTDCLLIECMAPLFALAQNARTLDELCESFEHFFMQIVVNCATISHVVLTFDFGKHALKDVEARTRWQQQQSNASKWTDVVRCYHEDRPRLMAALYNHLVHVMYIRPGLTLILSGLWPATLGIPFGDGARYGRKTTTPAAESLLAVPLCRVPHCVRTSECGRYRDVLAPWEVLDMFDELPLPRDPEQWFASTYEADDQLKFWLTVFLYARHGGAGSTTAWKIAVLSEDSNILLELLVLLGELIALAPEAQPKERAITRCSVHYMHGNRVGGHGAVFVGQPSTLERKRPLLIPEVINMWAVVRIFCSTLGPDRLERYSCPVFVLMFMVFMCRGHDYSPRVFLERCGAMEMFFAAVQHAPTWSAGVHGQVLTLSRPIPQGSGKLFASALDPIHVQLDVEPFIRLIKLMAGTKLPTWANDQALRAHAARMSLWLYKALNNHCPGVVLPHPCELVGETGVPRYGYTMTPSTGLDRNQNPLPPLCTPVDEAKHDTRRFLAPQPLTLGSPAARLAAGQRVDGGGGGGSATPAWHVGQ